MNKVTMQCASCKRDFQVIQHKINIGRKYCSVECVYNGRGWKVKDIVKVKK